MLRFIICPLNIYQPVNPYQTICIFFSSNSLTIKFAVQEFLGSPCLFLSVLFPEDGPVFHKAILLPALAVPFCQVIPATYGVFAKGKLFSSPEWSMGCGR